MKKTLRYTKAFFRFNIEVVRTFLEADLIGAYGLVLYFFAWFGIAMGIREACINLFG